MQQYASTEDGFTKAEELLTNNFTFTEEEMTEVQYRSRGTIASLFDLPI
jgi:hypothetical protein